MTAEQQELFDNNIALAVDLSIKHGHWFLPYQYVDLEDVIQMARLGLWDAATRYDARTGVPFGAYAGKVIVHAITRYADHLRRHSRVVETSLDKLMEPQKGEKHKVFDIPSPKDNPEKTTMILLDVQKMFENKPERWREIVWYLEYGYSQTEIAGFYGVTRAAINGALIKMRKYLPQYLTDLN
jgi:RNA polymerase sigma factor (sigma-70 family)